MLSPSEYYSIVRKCRNGKINDIFQMRVLLFNFISYILNKS